MENTTTLSLTLPSPLVWGIVTLGVVIVASWLVYLTLPSSDDTPGPIERFKARFGMEKLHSVPFLVTLTLWTGITLLLVTGLFGLIVDIIGDVIPGRGESGQIWEFRFKLVQLTALTGVLGAAIALPFTMIRLRLTQKQTDTATESLFNEKINAATQGLYARRQVTEWKRKDGYLHVWQDDIVQRNAAIDRLEGLADENPSEVPRIARLLSVYVRELSAEVPAAKPPENATPEQLQTWARALPKLRSDMEKAAQTLGRLADIALIPLENGEIDLRGANLQNADLAGLKVEKARFEGAQLQGADLIDAQFDAKTFLTAATLRAAVRNVDFTNIPQITQHLNDMFGDASVQLPEGVPRPDHWPDEQLNGRDFQTQWRAWQATLPDGWDKPDR